MKIIETSNNQLKIINNSLFMIIPSMIAIGLGLVLRFNPHLFLQSPPPIFSVFLIIAGGTSIVFFVSYESIFINKQRNQIQMQRYSILGKYTRIYSLSDVIKINYHLSATGPRTSNLAICLKSNSKIPITFANSTDNFRKTRALGLKISEFLNIPYEQDEISETGSQFYS